ncbi:Hypothetical protein NTJ_15486 [Nesidiocoris tenuis]|uniref:TLC domain-containing protein n=1 Tax=Nesidiocoris tenuis TaxID=355587 RepID=A0ABN7BE79_9HEMI|nr:Hypothetical protein NTJ_15486 [Nesidiocoris tenuis]
MIAATYWYFKGFKCSENCQTANLCSQLGAWLITSAVVIRLSPYELVPLALSKCTRIHCLYNVIAAIAYSHIALCYVWMELAAAMLRIFDNLDEKARKVGLGMLTDNALFTLRRHDGYVNMFTFMAWIFFIASLRAWLKNLVTRRPIECQVGQRPVCGDESSDSGDFSPTDCPPLPNIAPMR